MPDTATNTNTDPNTTTSTPPADGTPPPAAEGTPPPAPNAADETALGESGVKALEAERKARRDAEAAAKKATEELDKVRKSQLSEQDRAVEEAREAGKTEAMASVNRRLVEAEARAAAAGKLANPNLAGKLLDLEQFIPSDGSEIDGEAIAAAIDQLVEAEPYLAAVQAPPAGAGTPPAPPVGTVPGGAQGGTPPTFKRSQLRDPAFYTANKDAILKAASEGRITND